MNDNKMVTKNSNNPFIFPLLNIRNSIEFCMEKQIEQHVNNPQLLGLMAALHADLSKIDFGN